MRRALVLAITLGAAAPAVAHVAPSVDDNNRYLKLTPLGDRIRLAYVIFYGEIPGARLRPSLDTDRDGAISEREGQTFASKLGIDVAAALDVSIDGLQQRITWTTISAGLGSPRVAAGSFSVDLVAYLCLPTPLGRHQLELFDRFRLPRPGETEVKLDDSPGVRIERATLGAPFDPTGNFRFVGPGGPLADPGLDLTFIAGDHALVPSDGACGAPATPGRSLTPLIALALALVAVSGVWLLFRRLRARERAPR